MQTHAAFVSPGGMPFCKDFLLGASAHGPPQSSLQQGLL